MRSRSFRPVIARGERICHPRAACAQRTGTHGAGSIWDGGRGRNTFLDFTAVRSNSEGQWQLHVNGTLTDTSVAKQSPSGSSIAIAEIRKGLERAISCESYYDSLAKLGIDIGPGFRSVREAYQTDGELLARIECSAACGDDVVSWVHPALLDGALQTAGLAIPASSPETQDIYLLTEIERVELAAPLPPTVWCHAVARKSEHSRPHEWRVDLTVHSANGDAIGSVRGVCMRRASREALDRAVQENGRAAADNLFYRLAWELSPTAPSAASSLVSPERFVRSTQKTFMELAEQNDLAIYDKLLPELDRLSAGYIAAALRQLNFDDTVGRIVTVDAELARLGIATRHARLFKRIIETLVVDGILRRHGDDLQVACSLPATDPLQNNQALFDRFGAVDGELRTLQRCGPELARVLTGEQDPLQLLFPGGSLAEARKLYVEFALRENLQCDACPNAKISDCRTSRWREAADPGNRCWDWWYDFVFVACVAGRSCGVRLYRCFAPFPGPGGRAIPRHIPLFAGPCSTSNVIRRVRDLRPACMTS